VLFGELFGRHDEALRELRKAFVGMARAHHDALDDKQRARLAELIEAGPPLPSALPRARLELSARGHALRAGRVGARGPSRALHR